LVDICFGTEHEKRGCVGNASRPLRRGAPTGATSSGAMAMARDPGHGGLAFLHSSVFHFLSFLLLYTTIYLTISRITFISQFSYSFVIFLSCCPRSPRSPWAFYSRLRPRYDILSQRPAPPGCTSHRPVGPAPSTGPSTCPSPSSPLPTGSSTTASILDTP